MAAGPGAAHGWGSVAALAAVTLLLLQWAAHRSEQQRKAREGRDVLPAP